MEGVGDILGYFEGKCSKVFGRGVQDTDSGRKDHYQVLGEGMKNKREKTNTVELLSLSSAFYQTMFFFPVLLTTLPLPEQLSYNYFGS